MLMKVMKIRLGYQSILFETVIAKNEAICVTNKRVLLALNDLGLKGLQKILIHRTLCFVHRRYFAKKANRSFLIYPASNISP